LLEEWCFLLRMGLPQMVRFYFLCMADRMTLGFVGHFDPVQSHIAGAAVGKMYSNITGFSIGAGLAMGINTYASQNHGRGADIENGLVLRQCSRSMSIALVFCVLAAWASKPLLRCLDQPPDILIPVQHFSLIQALGLAPNFFCAGVSNTLLAQRISVPSAATDTLSAGTNLILAYIFLRCNMGYLGVAWAYAISQWIAAVLLFLYVVTRKKQATVWNIVPQLDSPGISFKTYMLATLPSAFSLWAEWWAAEILAVLSGLLPSRTVAVAACAFLLNTLVIFYMTFVAIQVATNTRVGNLVGAKDVQRLPSSVIRILVRVLRTDLAALFATTDNGMGIT
jgi:MATE family multidrug resistance protein